MGHLQKSPIGIFDSGLGGLSVLREIEKILPSEDIIYFGDTARLPYGTKSKNTIIRFSTQSALFLLKKKVKLIVIACNTSSSLALNHLKKVFSIPVLGVIEPGVKKALLVSKNKRIGVIGTKATIASLRYQRELTRRDKAVVTYSKACPLFVPLVEEGLLNGAITQAVITRYLKDLKGKADTLILGCTHYPLLKKAIGQYLKGVTLVDSAKEVAIVTARILKEMNIANTSSKKSKEEFYVTDEPEGFTKVARAFLKHKIKNVKVVSI